MKSDLIIMFSIFLLTGAAMAFATWCSYYHAHKSNFRPKFLALHDGRLQMEFDGFGGIQMTRAERFYEQYHEGMQVTYDGIQYVIAQIREIPNRSVVKTDIKMVCTLSQQLEVYHNRGVDLT